MTQPNAQREPISQPFEFLIVDEFLKTLVDARALKTAFELGLIDRSSNTAGVGRSARPGS